MTQQSNSLLFLLGIYIPRRNSVCTHTHTHTHTHTQEVTIIFPCSQTSSRVHCSVIHNSQDMETTRQPKCLSTDERVKKIKKYVRYIHIYVYTYICNIHTHINIHAHNGIVFRHEKEGNPAICDNMDGPGGCEMLSEISQTEKDKHCMISLTCEI